MPRTPNQTTATAIASANAWVAVGCQEPVNDSHSSPGRTPRSSPLSEAAR